MTRWECVKYYFGRVLVDLLLFTCPTGLQDILLAVLLWPVLFTISNPLNCGDEQSTLSNCLSISEEKLLDRVIQHAELIYRVSEESCSLFVSTADPSTKSASKPEHRFSLFFVFKLIDDGFFRLQNKSSIVKAVGLIDSRVTSMRKWVPKKVRLL